MVDFAKRVMKHVPEHLNGEPLVAATFVTPKGVTGAAAVGGAVGVLVKAGIDAHRAKGREESEFPNVGATLALTDRRVLVFDQTAVSGKPKNLIAEYSLDQVTTLEVDCGKLGGSLTIGVNGGEPRTFKVQKASKPQQFADAFRATVSA